MSGEKLEGKLVQWLVRQHEAKIVREPRNLPYDPQHVAIVANCVECRGTGYIGNARCRSCSDGNLWVVLNDRPPRLG
jgi:hypothetical protein